MDDVNINEIYLEEVERNSDGEEWVKLSWISKESDIDKTSKTTEIQSDLEESCMITKDDNIISCINGESEDISDGISVITESDTDTFNTNPFQISYFKSKIDGPLQMVKAKINKQADTKNIFIACILGIIIGLVLNRSFTISKTDIISNEIDTESLKIASSNIINTYKELTEVKAVLNKIKASIPDNEKNMTNFLVQLLKIVDSYNKMYNRSNMAINKSFNNNSYSLDQLQISLYILSSLEFIYDDNSPLKNEMSETLQIVNNTKAFYETLMLFNNTQNVSNSVALKFLQSDIDKIHVTSKLLLSNLVEKMRKITLSVYHKYTKMKYKFSKKMCHLKDILSDDEILKQLTENNQLFKDYDKSCLLNYTPKKLNKKTSTKENTKIKDSKKQIREEDTVRKDDDTVLRTKNNKENIEKIQYNNNIGLSKNEKNETQNALDVSAIMKSAHDFRCGHYFRMFKENKIHQKDANFLLKVENCTLLQSPGCTATNIEFPIFPHPRDSQLTNYSEVHVKATFDNILDHEAESIIADFNNKYDINNIITVADCESSAKILLKEEKSRSKQKYIDSRDYFKKTKKVFNGNVKKNNIFHPNQVKLKKYIGKKHIRDISEDSIIYRKQKQFQKHRTKQDKHTAENIRLDDIKRSHLHKMQQQQQSDTSDWYYQRVHSRENARKTRKIAKYKGNYKRC